MSDPAYQLEPVGWVESPLTDRADAPKQGDEGAPQARIVFRPEIWEATADLRAGDEILVLTWLHQGESRHALSPPARRPEPPAPGRLLHALAGSPQPDWTASRYYRERRGKRHWRPQSRSD